MPVVSSIILMALMLVMLDSFNLLRPLFNEQAHKELLINRRATLKIEYNSLNHELYLIHRAGWNMQDDKTNLVKRLRHKAEELAQVEGDLDHLGYLFEDDE